MNRYIVFAAALLLPLCAVGARAAAPGLTPATPPPPAYSTAQLEKMLGMTPEQSAKFERARSAFQVVMSQDFKAVANDMVLLMKANMTDSKSRKATAAARTKTDVEKLVKTEKAYDVSLAAFLTSAQFARLMQLWK
jgi:Spy/CpxP family protein refolding chaperone